MFQKENPIYIENNGIPLKELMKAVLQNKYDTKTIKENIEKTKDERIQCSDIQEFYKYENFTKDNVDKKVYMRGYMNADKSVAFISLENYEPNSARLNHAVIEINIASGVNGLMLGTLTGTNAQYVPSIRKCYFSQKDIEFTDEMLEELKPT